MLESEQRNLKKLVVTLSSKKMAIAGRNVAARKDGAVFAHSVISPMGHLVFAVIQGHKVVALRVWLRLLDNHKSGKGRNFIFSP